MSNKEIDPDLVIPITRSEKPKWMKGIEGMGRTPILFEEAYNHALSIRLVITDEES